MIKRIVYRIKQFLRVFNLRMSDDARAFVRSRLSIEETALFDNLSRYEKKHSLTVARSMAEIVHGSKEVDENDAIKFSLLHDIGKAAARFSVFDMALLVVFRRILPQYYNKLAEKGRESSNSTLKKIYAHKNHAAIGAELLRRAGTAEKIVKLVELHDKPADPGDPLELMLLRQLDERS